MTEYTNRNQYGTTYYYKDKEKTILHREDGPAIEGDDGVYKAWYLNGERHRVDGPAVVWRGGSKQWWINGVFIFIIDNNGKVTIRMK